jgi:hypothetical protein
MSQFDYDYPSNGMVGQLASSGRARVITIHNPLRAQVTNLEYNAITTDGAYSLTIEGSDGSSATSDVFTASSNTAAQICAGIVAGCLSDPEFAGLISNAQVITTDNVEITFAAPGVEYTVTANVPGSAPTQNNTTTAGYTRIAPGIILQANGSGGFSTTYSDAALALGVVLRNADMFASLSSPASVGYEGPAEMGCLQYGEVAVEVASGVTVSKGNKAYFNSTTKTWSNVTAGSHVLVEGAQWQTSGTGIQRVFVNLPSES